MNVTCPLCRCNLPEKLGQRSVFRSLEWYARFVENINLFDRDLYECQVCGFQFINPIYEETEFQKLYNQPGYETFVKATCAFDSYEDPRAEKALKIWSNTFLAAGVESWLK